MATTTTNFGFSKPAVDSATDQDVWGDQWNTNADSIDSQLATRTVAYDFNDNQLVKPEIKDYSETAQAVTASSTTAFNLEDGNVINLTHGVDISTLTISNPPATGKSGSFTVIRTKDNNATARSITWPASVKWQSGNEPTLTQTANAVDILCFVTTNGGTTWYGFAGGLNMS
jgi:hypothetical protein